MPRFPLFPSLPEVSGVSVEAAGQDTSTTTLTSITASGTALQWGSWTQLLASTAKKAILLIVCMDMSSAANMRVQIGVGASASESPIADISAGVAAAGSGNPQIYAPFIVNIPAVSRISARALSSTANSVAKVGVWLVEVD
jgi:hypothetical protein